MKSQREIKRQYAQLIIDVQTKEYYTSIDLTNRVNHYECVKCGYVTKTIDVDAGCTSMQIPCYRCQSAARSHFYEKLPIDKEPELEWYRPSQKETIKLRKKPHLLDHVLKGGLLLRKSK